MVNVILILRTEEEQLGHNLRVKVTYTYWWGDGESQVTLITIIFVLTTDHPPLPSYFPYSTGGDDGTTVNIEGQAPPKLHFKLYFE